jgi:hypothetical protein
MKDDLVHLTQELIKYARDATTRPTHSELMVFGGFPRTHFFMQAFKLARRRWELARRFDIALQQWCVPSYFSMTCQVCSK